MKKKILKKKYLLLIKKNEVLSLLLKYQTYKIENLKEEIRKLSIKSIKNNGKN